MSVDIANYNVGTVALFVGPSGGNSSVNVKVAGGGTVYYKADNGVSSASSDGNITNGNSATFTSPTWVASATTSSLTVTTYSGGGDVEALFENWVPVLRATGIPLAGATSAGTYLYTGTLGSLVAAAGTATGQGAFYLDPALWGAGSSAHSPKVRIRGLCITNAVAPACTTIGYSLLPVATTGGGSGAVPTIATVSAATVTASFATPLATTTTTGVSASAAHPAAGLYCVGVVIGTGGTAANANTVHSFELQVQSTAP